MNDFKLKHSSRAAEEEESLLLCVQQACTQTRYQVIVNMLFMPVVRHWQGRTDFSLNRMFEEGSPWRGRAAAAAAVSFTKVSTLLLMDQQQVYGEVLRYCG